MITCIIFDMDGTILNTLKDIQMSVNHAFQMKGYPLISIDDTRRAVGNGAKTLIKRTAPEHLSIQELDSTYHLYQSYYDIHHSDFTCPYDGIIILLKELKRLGYKLAVVSNKVEHLVKELNEKMFLGLFDVAIGEVKGIPIKPAPDMIYRALSLLDIPKEQSIFIGDSEVDILTAKHANLTSIGVTWGFRDQELLISHGADYIISEPKALLTILERGIHQ
jgi:phosphoglycolate phosphatase